MATVKNITIDQGATYQLDVTVTDSGGSPFNFAGWTPRGQIRQSYSAEAVLAEFTFQASLGLLTAILSATDTTALPSTGERFQLVYDFEIEDGTGTVIRVVEGKAAVRPEATK